MGSSPQFIDFFRTKAGPGGTMTFAQFMQLALYHPQTGYYRQPRRRVSRAGDADFFTASNSLLFGELMIAACTSLLKQHGAEPSEFTFVEIGAEEPGGGVLDGTKHPFKKIKPIHVGEPIDLGGRCVVFSNELFDAQPFHRFVFRRGTWREFGVTVRNDELAEVELSEISPEVASLVGRGIPAEPNTAQPEASPYLLPQEAAEDYRLDLSLAAESLAENIAAQPWTGLFVTCDYGKSWQELVHDTPAGTARAYWRHTQSNDLLARPGEQDLTCHVCWDRLGKALARHGFTSPQLQSQEAFFVHHAADFLAAVMAEETRKLSPRKQSLMQLLHPAHMGQKFQVLSAFRA
ncbi:MAG: SAM-dependent methyltransferase [Verrucomicrobiota bacterium]|nr:SAM-dependent methyltransferase [Verrucomicrobiota bacterium]